MLDARIPAASRNPLLISLFGLSSGATLATVVGVLIEVPAMLLVVKFVRLTRGWYERRAA